ncbi:MAG: acyl-CoA thioesterase [Alphaproteobacteria bacterium]|nr:acyl-CoA thioesterase [Alphaproteobacteria bacterium]
MADNAATRRDAYKRFVAITTRWADNDAYAHVNNVTYYSYFDTAVNHVLVTGGALDIEHATEIGVVVETMCRFFKPVAFPDALEAGLRVTKLGRSSVRYEIGIFKQGDDTAAAAGHFVHVYVRRADFQVIAVPESVKHVVTPLLVNA